MDVGKIQLVPAFRAFVFQEEGLPHGHARLEQVLTLGDHRLTVVQVQLNNPGGKDIVGALRHGQGDGQGGDHEPQRQQYRHRCAA